jgi:hypothetical protein
MLNSKDADDEEIHKEDDEDKNSEEEKASEILDMPPPWPKRIIIPLQKYNERSPTQT